jgi:hypothetical protein
MRSFSFDYFRVALFSPLTLSQDIHISNSLFFPFSMPKRKASSQTPSESELSSHKKKKQEEKEISISQGSLDSSQSDLSLSLVGDLPSASNTKKKSIKSRSRSLEMIEAKMSTEAYKSHPHFAMKNTGFIFVLSICVYLLCVR